MTDFKNSQPSWITIIEPVLSHQVTKTGSFVLPNANCSMIYGPEPAIFDGGQSLETTHYHVDACLWKEDTFIDGATFLMPSKLPEADLENYYVDLDETTGIYHVTLRKTTLRAALALTNFSKPDFSSHAVEFSNGEMLTVPRASCATAIFKYEAPKTPSKESQEDKFKSQLETFLHQHAENQPGLADSSVSASHKTISGGTNSAPAGLDGSIAGFGRVVGQQAANDQSSLSTFSKSIMHIVPWNATASTFIPAEVPDAAAVAQAQEPMENAVDIETSDNSSVSRRPSSGSQGSTTYMSTAPTSPASSTFSTEPFEKSTLAGLPKVPFAPGNPTELINALALERRKDSGPEETDDPDGTVIRRLAWDLRMTWRQLKHLDTIRDGESPYPENKIVPRNGLAMTEDGRIMSTNESGDEAESPVSSAQLTVEPIGTVPPNTVNTSISTQCHDMVDDLPLGNANQRGMSSQNLDPVPGSQEKQLPKQKTLDEKYVFEACEETAHKANSNQPLGASHIAFNVDETQGLATNSGSPKIDEMSDPFCHDREYTASMVNMYRTLSVVNIPSVVPIKIIAQSLTNTTASTPIRLGPPTPINAINAINAEFFRLWSEGVAGRCWIPGKDEDEVQRLAALNVRDVASIRGRLPDDIVLVAKDFNEIVARLWEQGHPQQSLLPDSDDEHILDELAARNLEWQYLRLHLENNLNQSSASKPLVQPRKIFEAAPSSFEWYLEALGGDGKYHEYRSQSCK